MKIRSFRNYDVPHILDLWKKSQEIALRKRLIPLDRYKLYLQVLGPPFSKPDDILIAFDEETPLGYVHTSSGPSQDTLDTDPTNGIICFMGLDRENSEIEQVAKKLLQAAERHLIERGAKRVFGGFPHPGPPFYTGLYGGGEAIGFFEKDRAIIKAFEEGGYDIIEKTVRFHLDLRKYAHETVFIGPEFENGVNIGFRFPPEKRTWWEACGMANFIWGEFEAISKRSNKPAASMLFRIADPETEEAKQRFGGTWDAALIDFRIDPEMTNTGLDEYVLNETIRFMLRYGTMQLESHVPESNGPFCSLLRKIPFRELEYGMIFHKTVRKTC